MVTGRRLIGLCLLVALAFTLMAGPAAAPAKKVVRKKVWTAASLDSVSADGIAGRVSTGPAPCRAKRTVTVYMANSASPTTFGSVATAITSGDGTWSIGGWAYPGVYYTVVASKKTRHFYCRGATSNGVTWWTSGAAQ